MLPNVRKPGFCIGERTSASAPNRMYTLYGLGLHYVQAEEGEPGITACVWLALTQYSCMTSTQGWSLLTQALSKKPCLCVGLRKVAAVIRALVDYQVPCPLKY